MNGKTLDTFAELGSVEDLRSGRTLELVEGMQGLISLPVCLIVSALKHELTIVCIYHIRTCAFMYMYIHVYSILCLCILHIYLSIHLSSIYQLGTSHFSSLHSQRCLATCSTTSGTPWLQSSSTIHNMYQWTLTIYAVCCHNG